MSYWTEKIPADWELETLDKSVSNIVDNRGRTAPTAKSGIPLIATNCIKEFGLYPVFEKVRYIDQETFNNWFRGHPEPNDILFVNKGTPGGVCIVPEPVPFCIAQDMVALRADPEKFDWKYLFAALRSDFVKSQIEALNVGTSIPHLKKTDFNRIVIPKPEYKDQVAIGEIYFSLSQKIELNLQMNKTLEEMAMALYKHWFVEFGPFQDGEFMASELGEIPKGWEIKTLGELLEYQKGFAFKSKWYQDEGKLVVRVSDTTENSIDVTTCNKVSEEIASNYLKYSLKRNDIIIATVGSWPPNYASVVGKVIRVPPTAENGLLNQNAVRLHMYHKGDKQQGLLYTTLKASRFLSYIVNCAQGSANQASIKLTDIFNYPIPYNENIDLDIFTTQIENFISLQNSNIQENQTLTQLRDTLLPKLISGEVRVKDVEKTLSEVL